jgi:pimeloyl-ACP methyl ester carboxylesterase
VATFGLVHGSWHGDWCWVRLERELDARGRRSVAVDLPIEDPDAGLSRHAELVADSLLGVDGDVILVGHSMSGSIIPLVARHRPLRHLVFLCALVPEPGGSVTDRYTKENVYVPGFVGTRCCVTTEPRTGPTRR